MNLGLLLSVLYFNNSNHCNNFLYTLYLLRQFALWQLAIRFQLVCIVKVITTLANILEIRDKAFANVFLLLLASLKQSNNL